MSEGSATQVLAGEATWSITHGSCAELLRALPDRSVHHVITDPPYSEHTHKNMRGNRGEGGIVVRDPGFAPMNAQLRRLCCAEFSRIATGWLAIFSDWESIGWWRISLNAAGGSYRRAVPWVRWSSPQFNGQSPPTGSEAVIFAKPIARDRQWLNGGRTHYEEKCLRNVNKVAGHETEKPEPLMDAILLDCTEPGDIVVDPFCGSGTTGASAVRLGRRFIGFEKRAEWAERSRSRLRAVSADSSLRAADVGQEALFR
jgi:DNA modification methylase